VDKQLHTQEVHGSSPCAPTMIFTTVSGGAFTLSGCSHVSDKRLAAEVLE